MNSLYTCINKLDYHSLWENVRQLTHNLPELTDSVKDNLKSIINTVNAAMYIDRIDDTPIDNVYIDDDKLIIQSNAEYQLWSDYNYIHCFVNNMSRRLVNAA